MLLEQGAASTAHSQSSPRALMEILLWTKDAQVYRSTRRAALALYPRYLGERSTDIESREINVDIEFEYSCWVDGLTQETLEDLCVLIRQSSPEPIRSRVALVAAWEKLPGDVPRLNVSPLLVHALGVLSERSPPFRALVCQVAARCLMHHFDPLPLAALCVSSLNETKTGKNLTVLFNYTHALIHFNEINAKDRTKHLSALLTQLFDGSCFAVALIARPWHEAAGTLAQQTSEELSVSFQQMAHVFLVSPEQEQPSLSQLIVQRLFSCILRVCEREETGPCLHEMLFLTCLSLQGGCENIKSTIKRLISVMNDSQPQLELHVADLIVRSSANEEFLKDEAFWASCWAVTSLGSAESEKDLISAALFAYVVFPFVPIQCLPHWVLATLDVSMSKPTFQALGLKVVERALAEKDHQLESGELLTGSLVKYWAHFPDTRTSAGMDLLFCLDQLLATFLSSDSPPHISIEIERQFVALGIEAVIRRCVAVKRCDRSNGMHLCLLARLIELNALDYAAVLLGLLDSGDADLRARILKLGNFDNAVLGALRSQGCGTVHSGAIACATKSYLEQVIDLVGQCSSPEMNLHSANLLFSELVRFDTWNDADIIDQTDALQEALVQHLRPFNSTNAFDAYDDSYRQGTLRLATLLCLHELNRKRHTLASVVMFRLFEQKYLSRQHIDCATKLLEASFVMHGELKLNWRCVVDRTLNSCLLIGLRLKESASDFEDASSYLKFCLLLLKASESSLQRTSQSLAVSTLNTITMHPGYHSAIALPGDDDSVAVKAHILELMLRCTSIARSYNLDTKVINTLLEGFDASTTLCDALIRRLLLECCRRRTEVRALRKSDGYVAQERMSLTFAYLVGCVRAFA
jgi:hypothetical protein